MQTDKLPKSRTRGLEDLQKEVGNLSAEIDARISKGQDKVRIAEIGFGYGSVLVDLVQKYGDKVELHGFNRFEEHGNNNTIHEVAKRRYFESPLLDEIKLYYFDVCGDWPVPDDYFDVIYSQSVFLHLPDRVKTFHEMNRTLKPDGIARVEACLVRPKLASQYQTTFIVKDGERELSFEEYARAFSNIKFKVSQAPLLRRSVRTAKQWLKMLRNSKKKPTPRQPYMEMTKGAPFDLGLTLEESIDIRDHYQIKKSTYRANGEAKYPGGSKPSH